MSVISKEDRQIILDLAQEAAEEMAIVDRLLVEFAEMSHCEE